VVSRQALLVRLPPPPAALPLPPRRGYRAAVQTRLLREGPAAEALPLVAPRRYRAPAQRLLELPK
jgi:hypothetical protein